MQTNFTLLSKVLFKLLHGRRWPENANWLYKKGYADAHALRCMFHKATMHKTPDLYLQSDSDTHYLPEFPELIKNVHLIDCVLTQW